MASKRISLLVSIGLLLLLTGCPQDRRQAPVAEGAVLDLRSWDFARDGSVNLNGQWAFYWRQLLSPDDFVSSHQLAPTRYIPIPGTWNKHLMDGTPLGGDGFAAFRLKVLLTPDEKTKAIHILNQSSAYTLWINGRIVAANGVVGNSKQSTTPQYLLQEVSFFEVGPVLDIIIQVANFNHRKGGIWNPIRLGLAKDMESQRNQQWIFDLFLFGSLFIMGAYHFSLYLVRRKDTSTLFFAIFTLVMAMRVLVSGNFYLTVMFPHLPWELVYKMEVLTVFIAPPALLLFITSLFNGRKSMWIVYVFVGMGIAFSLFALMSPARFSSHLVMPNQAVLLLNIGYMLYILINAVQQGKEGAALVFTTMAILGCAAVLDILNANRVLYTIQLSPFGVLFLIFSQSFVLSSRYAGAFKGVEELSTELERNNIALERMSQIKDEFLANTSHELRTPLNGIIGLAESMGDGAPEELPNSIKGNLELIAASGRRLSSLINDILDFSRLKNRDLRLNMGAVDIRTLTNAVLAISKPLTTGKDLVLKNQIPDNLPFIHGDEHRLQQILYNLVGNAIKFTQSGEVSVTGVQENSMVKVNVTDTGVGIAEEHFDTIFKSFEQVQAAESRSFGGAGLGLAITRHLVELHQGSIGVSSELNRGTTFYFTIPVIQDDGVSDQGPSVAKSLPPVANLPTLFSVSNRAPEQNTGIARKILVVDDDPVNLQVVKNQLSFLDDIAVHTCLNGPVALDWIEEQGCPDLVLLDIMMPQMTGYEVCRILRRKHASHKLPVIILTAKNRVTDLTRGFACGANDYLTKPFARDELLARVRTQLDLKQSYETFRENLKLKKELEQRESTELDLRMMQRRLSRIMDTLNDAVIAVNESHEITFCNNACERMLGHEAGSLLGRPVKTLFPDDSPIITAEIPGWMGEQDHAGTSVNPTHNITVLHKDAGQIPSKILLAPLDLENEHLLVMILQKADKMAGAKKNRFDLDSALLVIEELNKNRQRIQILEESLNTPHITGREPEMRQSLKKIDAMLSQMGRTFTGNAKDIEKKKLGVRVMKLALRYWEYSTGSTKADLAIKSNLWKVYMTVNGFERTQTLDRYLDIQNFPQIPRWRQVYQTADFVLSSCRVPSSLRDELETELSKLRVLK